MLWKRPLLQHKSDKIHRLTKFDAPRQALFITKFKNIKEWLLQFNYNIYFNEHCINKQYNPKICQY